MPHEPYNLRKLHEKYHDETFPEDTKDNEEEE